MVTGTLRGILALFLIYIVAALVFVSGGMHPGYVFGWDAAVYDRGIVAVHQGHDPYADAIAAQERFHAEEPHPLGTPTPYSYVYSPMTLPVLKLLGDLPRTVEAVVYWMAYAVCAVVPLGCVWMFAGEEERGKSFLGLLPLLLFYPALMAHNVVFSGNIAYILYGFLIMAATAGWRAGRWWPFYAVVLAASCIKAPLLTLLAVPVLSEAGQWIPAVATAVSGMALFLLQRVAQPKLFMEYLKAVDLQFLYNRDFSASPSGVLADALYGTLPYKLVATTAYLAFAAIFVVLLLLVRRRFLAGELTQRQWVPVMLVGTVLLNPRIMEYDLAPITPFLALLLWRETDALSVRWRLAVVVGIVILLNIVGVWGTWWRPMASLSVVAIFFAGCWKLLTLRTSARGVGDSFPALHNDPMRAA